MGSSTKKYASSAELVEALKDYEPFKDASKAQRELAVSAFMASVQDVTVEYGSLLLKGFGTFRVHERGPRKIPAAFGRALDPNAEPRYSEAKSTVKFKPGSDFVAYVGATRKVKPAKKRETATV